MPLTQEEIKEFKDQLRSQIKDLPDQQRQAAESQIDSLSPDALEAMVEEQKQRSQKSIFRLIVSGEMDTVKVGENDSALAVLDINPISSGHSMVIPKEAAKTEKDIPKQVYDLASELSKKIISSLGAKEVKTFPSTQFGEAILHLIPIYDKSLTLNSQRSKASQEDLEKIRSSLEVIKIEKNVEKIKKTKPRGRKPEPIVLNRKVP